MYHFLLTKKEAGEQELEKLEEQEKHETLSKLEKLKKLEKQEKHASWSLFLLKKRTNEMKTLSFLPS